MYSLNKTMIIGNATRDPEVRYIPSGQAVASFGVATNRRWKGASGEFQETTEFHNVVGWGKTAEILGQYLKKGNKIFIEGRLQTRSWDSQDGSKKQRTEIVIENFVLLSPKGGDNFVPNISQPAPAEMPEPVKEPDDGTDKKKSKTSKEDKSEVEDDIDLDEIPF